MNNIFKLNYLHQFIWTYVFVPFTMEFNWRNCVKLDDELLSVHALISDQYWGKWPNEKCSLALDIGIWCKKIIINYVIRQSTEKKTGEFHSRGFDTHNGSWSIYSFHLRPKIVVCVYAHTNWVRLFVYVINRITAKLAII